MNFRLASLLLSLIAAPATTLIALPRQGPLKPGPEHALRQKLCGTWDAVLITRDPKGAELNSKGTLSTTRSSDFHTVDSFQGEFMGMPMTGHGMNGYCTVRREFFTFWTDSMTPSPMTLRGSFDAATRTLTLRGECYGMSGKLEPCRTVLHVTDDDHYEWALFGAGPDGKEQQHLRIEYTRHK